MAIVVGINEPVLFKGGEINEKGTLEVVFGVPGVDISEVPTDDLLNDAAGVKPRGNDTKFILWPIDVEANGEKKEADRISKDVVSLRDQLEHILQQFFPKVEAMLNPYDGLSLTKDNFKEEILKQPVVDRMYKNLTTQFVAKVKTLTEADLAKELRLLCVRRSTSSHYPSLRKVFISDNPFLEPAIIPATASKLKFTKFEIERGMNDGTPVKKEQVADQTDATQSTADDILGTR